MLISDGRDGNHNAGDHEEDEDYDADVDSHGDATMI